MVALLTLCESGDEIVAAHTLYGGSYSQLDVSLRKLGIDTRFVDPSDPENFRRAITGRTRAVFGEIIGNPGLNVFDLAGVAAVLALTQAVPSTSMTRRSVSIFTSSRTGRIRPAISPKRR